jgi:hypothetical protein
VISPDAVLGSIVVAAFITQTGTALVARRTNNATKVAAESAAANTTTVSNGAIPGIQATLSRIEDGQAQIVRRLDHHAERLDEHLADHLKRDRRERT